VIDKQGIRTKFHYNYFVIFGAAVEEFKKTTGKEADQNEEVVKALTELIEFSALKPTN